MTNAVHVAAEVLAHAPVLDGHNDLPWALRENWNYDIAQARLDTGNSALHTDIPALRAGGVGAQFWSVYVSSSLEKSAAVAATLEQIDCVHRLIAAFPEDLQLATSAADVDTALRTGRIASLLGAEGGHSIAESLAVLRMLRRLGVTYMTLTHNDNTSWAASATGEPTEGGLTDFGREVVTEMNRIGMLVDLSHVHEQTMQDALDTSTVPVIFSHSSCRGVHEHPRNVPDTVLERLSANGGIQMLTFVPRFLSSEPQTAGIDDVVAHIEHAREVAGVNHIGLGGDFDGIPEGPAGLRRVSDYPAMLTALAERNWSAADLAKLTSQNAVRVLHDAGV
ncbi:dipeptidase [Nesterenkonia muleiensis]|uniref:dipeptidase n=1 Tax=Nesterenkonia muleiensis TaxID=2282648 RepID=UPI000E74BC09|nr:dipeptidase [Nesterenkonia muleiensis]